MAAEVSENAFLAALNSAWSKLTVAPGYNLVFSIGHQAYRISSADGQLRADELKMADVKEALAETTTHVAVTDKHAGQLRSGGGKAAVQLKSSQHVVISGDSGQLGALAVELAPTKGQVERELAESMATIPAEEEQADEPRTLRLPVEGTVFNNAAYSSQGFWTTCCAKLEQWVHFSAFTVMSGNSGQGNYTAANAQLDCVTYHGRQSGMIREPTSYMWGAVAGIGMRQKAFGSEDFLLKQNPELLFTVQEAALICRMFLFGQSFPEWVSGCILDPDVPWLKGGAGIYPADKKGYGAAISLQHLQEEEEAAEEARQADQSALVVGALADRIQGTLASKALVARSKWWSAGREESTRRLEEYQATLKLQRDFKEGSLDPTVLAPLIREHLQEQPEDASTEAGDSSLRDSDCSSSISSEQQATSRRPAARKPQPVKEVIISGTAAAPAVDPQPACSPSVGKAHAQGLHLIVAGSWDGWIAHALEWDSGRECFVFEVTLSTKSETFQVFKGSPQSTEKRVRPARSSKTWTLTSGSKAGRFEIRAIPDENGRVRKVEWSRL